MLTMLDFKTMFVNAYLFEMTHSGPNYVTNLSKDDFFGIVLNLPFSFVK